MRLIERLSVETEEFHIKADEDGLLLFGPVTAADYRRFLVRMYGFVAPVERAVAGVRGIERAIDPRRFRKTDMLRIDLLASRLTAEAIDALPQCSVHAFDRPEEALAWAYPIERSTLGHMNLYRHLATKLPGDVAFASSYLKCYFGVVGESWKSYGDALEALADSDIKAQRVIDCARGAFRAWRSWRVAQEEHLLASADGGIREKQRA